MHTDRVRELQTVRQWVWALQTDWQTEKVRKCKLYIQTEWGNLKHKNWQTDRMSECKLYTMADRQNKGCNF